MGTPETPRATTEEQGIRANGGARQRRNHTLQPRSRLSRTLSGAGLGLLSLAAASVAWQLPPRLAVDDPLVGFICLYVDCGNLPKRDDALHVAQISMHNVRFEQRGGKLSFTGRMTNNAEHNQPYPVLVIQLFSADGHLVSKHRVNPTNYLDKATDLPLMVGQTQQLKYTIDDPGAVAMQYAIQFRPA